MIKGLMIDYYYYYYSFLLVGNLMKRSYSKKSMRARRSLLEAEEDTATIHTKTNTVARKRLLIETGCSSAISLMT